MNCLDSAKSVEGESEFGFIWTQAKTLDLMANSMLKRSRFFLPNNSVQRMSASTFEQTDAMINRLFMIYQKDLKKKQLNHIV